MTSTGRRKEVHDDDDDVYTEIRNSTYETVNTSSSANRSEKQTHNKNDRTRNIRTNILFVVIGCLLAGFAIYCLIKLELTLERKISQMEDEIHQLKQYNAFLKQNGSEGEKGYAGDQGPKGLKGEKGNIGDQGSKGRRGDKGETGDRGSPGSKGSATVPVVFFQADFLKTDKNLKNRTIVFKQVTANNGGGYSNTNGHFTAPEAGVYLFILQICPESSKKVAMEIVANNNIIGRLNTFHTYVHGPCVSTSGITELNKGDQVWIRCNDADTGDSVWNQFVNGNKFAGVLIHTGT